MLDANFIRDHVDEVKQNCRHRRVSENVLASVDRVVAFEAERKRLVQKRSETAAKQNELSRQFQKASPAEREALKAQSTQLKEEIAVLDAELKILEGDLLSNLYVIPNMSHPEAPVGGEEANRVLSRHGQPRVFNFPPKDHVALCELLDLCDFEAGARVAGQKFYFLKNAGALLEMALVQYAMQTCVRKGYTPIITPDLARVEVLEGIGFQPRDTVETRQVYTIADSDLCLVATAEITLGGMHKDQTLDEADLPRRYVGLSHCFRTEAGAAGRDTRGLYRVHQFTKVEMFAYTTPEASEAMHHEILAIEQEIFQGLGLPYQVIDTATGDLGGPAYRKFDLEAWMPGRGDAGAYGEVTSTSNCTDYQARRLGIRYKSPQFKGTRFLHTLNGTAVSCARAIIAILENYQNADGSVTVPEVLRPWMGMDVITPRK